jgi:hypothetical protein
MKAKEKAQNAKEILANYVSAIRANSYDFPNTPESPKSDAELREVNLSGKTSQQFMIKAVTEYGDIWVAFTAIGGIADNKVKSALRWAIIESLS